MVGIAWKPFATKLHESYTSVPKLRFGDEYEFSALPRYCLAPEVGETVEGVPMIEEIEVPYACQLEVGLL